MNIRHYQPSDEETVMSLWWDSWHSSASFRHPKPLSEWRLRWHEMVKTHEVILAIIDDEIVGFVAVHTGSNTLAQLFVMPDRKKQGVGRKLFEWALSRCGGSLTLKTLRENTEAREFYRRLGMRESGTSINDFNGMEEVVYAL